MKVRLNKTAWRAVIGTAAAIILVVTFQNCGKAGFDAELDSQLGNDTSDAALTAKYGESTAAKVAAIPFAFEASFDTITYNSCADTHLRNNAAFTSLKAGAYSTAGISLKQEYFDYADQNFKPIYPEPNLSEAQYKEYLSDSPLNADTVPNMAIRVKNSLTDVYSANSQVTLNLDVIPMVGTMTDALVMDSFSKKGITANYFPFSPEQRVMEAGISFNSDEKTADDYRDIFMTSGILALSYMRGSAEEIYKIKSSSDAYPVKSAYGKGYNLTFSPYPMAGASSLNPSRVLSQVMEYDLSAPGVGARNWNCGRVYKVVRSQDAVGLCPPHSFSEIRDNPALRLELSIMRRHLRADQWDVNVTRKCVVPKGSVSCYKEENLQAQGFSEVEYDLSKACYRPNAVYPGERPTSKCLHFVTVCTRD